MALNDYLASGEELLLSFSAENVTQEEQDDNKSLSDILENAGNDSSYQFGATDRRIVYLDNSGSFKDIDYGHISSIESDREKDYSEQGAGMTSMCCGGILALGGLMTLLDSPVAALFGLLLGGGLLAVGVKILQSASAEEEQKVKFITGDEAHQQIEVTLTPNARENIGAELSRILREQRQ